MPYQYKREPLNNDEVNKLINACDNFREKFFIWTLLDTGLRLSEFVTEGRLFVRPGLGRDI
jgi:integrase/recombinase XerD